MDDGERRRSDPRRAATKRVLTPRPQRLRRSRWTFKPAASPPTPPDDFVVFFIGMRINNALRVNEWVPVMRAAFAMVKELKAMPDTPLLGSRTALDITDPRITMFIQYWRSLDELEAWANDKDKLHRPAQRAFFKRTAYNGHVGVWHETFLVKAGQYETIYANMPATGLAAAGEYRSLSSSSRLRDRVGTPAAQ